MSLESKPEKSYLNYEQAKPFELERIESQKQNCPRGTGGYKPKLKADKLTGEIIIDEKTTLKGIPKKAVAVLIMLRLLAVLILLCQAVALNQCSILILICQ